MSDDVFTDERPRLVGLAYRLLGSLNDAEDIVQEAWVRWNRADQPSIANPAAWLTTVVSRIGIDKLRSRQRDRAEYVGPWLPEPLVSFDDEPAAAAELSDSLTTAFLVMLERLSPQERLVLLLADVFQEPFAAVADVVGKSEDATRQMAVRARRKVRTDHEWRPPSRAEQLAVANDFVAAILVGDEHRVRELLTPDAVLTSDGGAARHAARRAVVGQQRITRFIINIMKRWLAIEVEGVSMQAITVNGMPGIVFAIHDRPYWVAGFEVREGRVDRLYTMLNPDKLTAVGRHTDLV